MYPAENPSLKTSINSMLLQGWFMLVSSEIVMVLLVDQYSHLTY